MYFGSVCFRGEFSFLYCDDVCMYVVSKQFDLLKFVFNSDYVDLKYNEIFPTYTARSVYACGCGDCDVCNVVFVGCV